jgi:soluble lytic murein transglycosylase-like protein
MKTYLIALILQIATNYNLPPYLLVAIAEVESEWNVEAIHVNNDGTIDRGLMQLNSSWFNHDNWYDPVVNINAAAAHIAGLRQQGLQWYQIAVAYNCGVSRLRNPPLASITYAIKVFNTWESYDSNFMMYVGR